MSQAFFRSLLLGAITISMESSLRAGSVDFEPGRDFLQTIQARKALLDDPQLARLNLGIQVQAGVAKLWGPVPTLELSQRAEQKLRSLIELLDVRNDLIVTDEDMVPTPQPSAPSVLPDYVPPALPSGPRRAEPVRPRPNTVELVGDLQPLEPLTVHASPAPRLQTHHVRLPLVGTIEVPK